VLNNRHITLATLLLSIVLSAGVRGEDGLQAAGAWIREAPPGSTVLAGYMNLANNGVSAVTVTGVSSPEFGSGEIHLSRIEAGMAQMIPVAELQIPPGKEVRLQPGSYHVMLFRPVRELHDGDVVTLLLHLAEGQCLQVNATVLRNSVPDRGP
jgi:copper(I)-binding protein